MLKHDSPIILHPRDSYYQHFRVVPSNKRVCTWVFVS